MKKLSFLIIAILLMASIAHVKSEAPKAKAGILAIEQASSKCLSYCDSGHENILFEFIVPDIFVLAVGLCVIISKLTFKYVNMEKNFKYRKQLPRGNPVLI